MPCWPVPGHAVGTPANELVGTHRPAPCQRRSAAQRAAQWAAQWGAPVSPIVIYGAGHVGAYVGARLLHGGAPVTLIGRPRMLQELRQHGLAFSDWQGGAGRLQAQGLVLSDQASAAAGAGLVLLCVKSAATAAAGAELAAVLAPGAVVVSLQNGVANVQTLRQLLPRQVALAGMVAFNVVPLGQGRLHQATEGGLEVQDHPALGPWLPSLAQAGLPLHLHANMAPVQWGKLLLNLSNPINALSGLPLKAMLAQRDYRLCMALAQREALRLLPASGIVPARLTPLPAAWLPAVLSLPNGLFTRLARRMLEVDPQARSSMWADLDQGRASEVDWLNGEVVRLAVSYQGRAPVNACLVRLMHEAQAGGRRDWPAPELLAQLRAAARSASS